MGSQKVELKVWAHSIHSTICYYCCLFWYLSPQIWPAEASSDWLLCPLAHPYLWVFSYSLIQHLGTTYSLLLVTLEGFLVFQRYMPLIFSKRGLLILCFCTRRGYVKVKVVQSCLTLGDPVDYTVHGILQARKLEKTWAFPFSRGSSQPRDRAQVSNPDLLHRRWILYQLSHKGSPRRDYKGLEIWRLFITTSKNKNNSIKYIFKLLLSTHAYSLLFVFIY